MNMKINASVIRRPLLAMLGGLLSACSATAPPVQLPEGTPTAKLRVGVESNYATNIELNRTSAVGCPSKGLNGLGWFHPNASGEWQKRRRLYGLRQPMALSSHLPDNMHAEHVVALDQPFQLVYSATFVCSGSARLSLSPGREYEFILSVTGEGCQPRLYELIADRGMSRREPRPIEPVNRCP
jgi:hypothetical protein